MKRVLLILSLLLLISSPVSADWIDYCNYLQQTEAFTPQKEALALEIKTLVAQTSVEGYSEGIDEEISAKIIELQDLRKDFEVKAAPYLYYEVTGLHNLYLQAVDDLEEYGHTAIERIKNYEDYRERSYETFEINQRLYDLESDNERKILKRLGELSIAHPVECGLEQRGIIKKVVFLIIVVAILWGVWYLSRL